MGDGLNGSNGILTGHVFSDVYYQTNPLTYRLHLVICAVSMIWFGLKRLFPKWEIPYIIPSGKLAYS